MRVLDQQASPPFLDHPPHCKPPLPNGHAHTLPTLAGSQWGRRRPRSRYSGGCAAQQGGPRAPALLALGELVSTLCAPPPAAALLLLSPLLCCSSCACCLPCVGAASGRRMRVAVWDCCLLLLLVWQEARHAVDGLLLLLEEQSGFAGKWACVATAGRLRGLQDEVQPGCCSSLARTLQNLSPKKCLQPACTAINMCGASCTVACVLRASSYL